LTCGTCGHRGEDGKDYAHDCYWVFRERGKIGNMAKKRGYSTEFPTDHKTRARLEIDRVDPAFVRRVRAKAKREGVSLRTLIQRLLTQWLNG
jgi:predicted HicB family RNase H-like nuclease